MHQRLKQLKKCFGNVEMFERKQHELDVLNSTVSYLFDEELVCSIVVKAHFFLDKRLFISQQMTLKLHEHKATQFI